jgi:hypothetical protein
MLGASLEFTPNPGFEEELAADPATRLLMMGFAERALEAARAAAPVVTGRYRDSLDVAEYHGAPALISRSSFWHFVEFGSVHNPPHAPLRQGVAAAGFDMTDS